ncbi:MAG: PilZ domain-containing protein [Leptonema sp. (in: bacteria)]
MENKDLDPFIREKRKYPRLDLIFDIQYELLKDISEEEVKSYEGKGKDISLGGMSFECKGIKKIQEGDIIFIKLSLQELEGNLNAMGRIVRIWEENNKTFCAVKITTMDPVDYEILNNIIRENLNQNLS